MKLRQVTHDDAALLWEWANDAAVRAASFRSKAIGWDSHVDWLRAKLADPRCRMYIALDEAAVPVAQVRFDVTSSGDALVSISVAPNARGHGHGGGALQLACERVSRDVALNELVAYVKPDNAASLRMFEHSGFVRRGSTRVDGTSAIVLTRVPLSVGLPRDIAPR